MQLNPAQERAVLHSEGPLVVFAGAGSGKTRVITYRVANLLANKRVPPYRILAVTFTNKAAQEMRARLDELAGEDLARELWVGTFHSVCCRLLRRYHNEVGLGRNFVIYDDADQKSLVTRIIRRQGIEERLYPPKQVLSRIHRQKQEGHKPADVKVGSSFDQTTLDVFEAYEKALLTANAVDFDDLILHMMRLAEHRTSPAGAELRDRFDYLLVDEFQDTNAIQYRLVRALASRSRNLCVVGDDDQSIYSWRGADVRNIRGFRNDFAGAEIVKLEQNYRSAANIVASALGVISGAPDREPKRLWTEAEAGDKVRVNAMRDERDEAESVVRAVRNELASGTPADQIAVFYRINAQSRVIEEAFRSAGLPYQIVGGMRFFERAEVKDALAYLRLLDNPKSDADLLRIINVPARGIGGKTVQVLLDRAVRDSTSLWTALGALLEARGLGVAAKKKLVGFRDLIQGLRETAETTTPLELAQAVLDQTGYRKLLRDADTAEADARLENLEEFVGSIGEYTVEAERIGEEPSVSGYLERVSLVSDIDGVEDEPTALLMTVHAAKGLEFDSVFLTGMEEEMFPYRGVDGTSPDELEEERRLAYVAITRARTRLTISHASARTIFGYTRYNSPSRFLNDLPDEVVERSSSAWSTSVPPAPSGNGGWWQGGRKRRAYDEFDQSVPATASYGSDYFGSPSNPDMRAGERASAPRTGGQERQIDYDAFDDTAGEARELRRGSPVFHDRFGRGTVQSVTPGEPPKVTARFPGWGERRVLMTKLRVR
jgi:DNA helicase-2/ATP-dependent DNA helicase PcrA